MPRTLGLDEFESEQREAFLMQVTAGDVAPEFRPVLLRAQERMAQLGSTGDQRAPPVRLSEFRHAPRCHPALPRPPLIANPDPQTMNHNPAPMPHASPTPSLAGFPRVAGEVLARGREADLFIPASPPPPRREQGKTLVHQGVFFLGNPQPNASPRPAGHLLR